MIRSIPPSGVSHEWAQLQHKSLERSSLAKPNLKAATESDSVREAGSEFHSGTVWMVKKFCNSLVEARGYWSLCLCLARVRESGLVSPRVSVVMSTWPCIILKRRVRRRSRRLSATFLQPS